MICWNKTCVFRLIPLNRPITWMDSVVYIPQNTELKISRKSVKNWPTYDKNGEKKTVYSYFQYLFTFDGTSSSEWIRTRRCNYSFFMDWRLIELNINMGFNINSEHPNEKKCPGWDLNSRPCGLIKHTYYSTNWATEATVILYEFLGMCFINSCS